MLFRSFLILLGASQAKFWYSVVAATGVILSAAYLLWLYQRVFLQEVVHEENRHLADASLLERVVLTPLCVMALVMGVASPLFIRPMQPSTERLMRESTSAVQRVELQAPAAGKAKVREVAQR